MKKFIIVFLFSIVMASCSDEPVIPAGYENLLGEWESYKYCHTYVTYGYGTNYYFEYFLQDSIPFFIKLLVNHGNVQVYFDNTSVINEDFDEYQFTYDNLTDRSNCSFYKNGHSKLHFDYIHSDDEIEIKRESFPFRDDYSLNNSKIYLRKVN